MHPSKYISYISAQQIALDIEVINNNVAKVAWLLLFCYPFSFFYLIIKYYFKQYIWFNKANFRFCLIYQFSQFSKYLAFKLQKLNF